MIMRIITVVRILLDTRCDNENYNCGKKSTRYALFCRNGRSASRTPVWTREDLVYISEWMFSPLSKSLNRSTVLPKCYLKHISDPLMYIYADIYEINVVIGNKNFIQRISLNSTVPINDTCVSYIINYFLNRTWIMQQIYALFTLFINIRSLALQCVTVVMSCLVDLYTAGLGLVNLQGLLYTLQYRVCIVRGLCPWYVTNAVGLLRCIRYP